MLRRLVWIAIVLAVAAGGAAFFLAARRTAPLSYETTTVDRGRVQARATATGTLSALVTVQVGSQVSGRIQEILVDYNSPVKKGEVLARIDPELFQAALAQAKANVVAATASVAKAQAEADNDDRQLKRSQVLADQHYIAQSDLDTAETALAVARAGVDVAKGGLEQAKASLVQAEVNNAYTTILSPIDGTVISRAVDVGQTVAASLQAPTLFTLAEDMRKMQVDTNVAEADVGKIKADMPATFTVDAYPNQRFAGTVRQVRAAPIVQQNVVTYDAVIDVDNPDLALKPGMTANVTFTWADRGDVVRVPNAALRFRPTSEQLAAFGIAPDAGKEKGSKATGAGGDPGKAPADGEPGKAPAGGGADGKGGKGGKGHGHGQRDPNQRTVYALRDGKPTAVAIRVGVSDGSLTELVEGELKEGDLLITDVTGGASAHGGGSMIPVGGQPSGGMRRMF